MRWVMGLIIAAGVLAGAWPSARVLWEMETGAARVDAVLADGSVQQAEIGPRSHWPDWALRPEGTAVTVRAHFGPGGGRAESGHAEIGGFRDAARVQAAYAGQLAAAGWEVRTAHVTLALPQVPPRSARLCQVIAQKDANSLLLSVTTDGAGLSQLHWSRGPLPETRGARPGPCPSGA